MMASLHVHPVCNPLQSQLDLLTMKAYEGRDGDAETCLALYLFPQLCAEQKAADRTGRDAKTDPDVSEIHFTNLSPQ